MPPSNPPEDFSIPVIITNDETQPVPVTGSVEVELPAPNVFQISHSVNYIGGQSEEVSEILAEAALLLTVDIRINNVFLDEQKTCFFALRKNGINVITREFFDRNPGEFGARSDQAVNLSLAPGVRFNAGDEITSFVTDNSGGICTGHFNYFFRAL